MAALIENPTRLPCGYKTAGSLVVIAECQGWFIHLFACRKIASTASLIVTPIPAATVANGKRSHMKNETTESLIASGDLIHAEDCVFVLDMVMTLFDRSAETQRDSFLNLGIAVLEIWRESLATLELDEADAAINIIMNGKL